MVSKGSECRVQKHINKGLRFSRQATEANGPLAMKDLPEFFSTPAAGRMGFNIVIEFPVELRHEISVKDIFDNDATVPLDRVKKLLPTSVIPYCC